MSCFSASLIYGGLLTIRSRSEISGVSFRISHWKKLTSTWFFMAFSRASPSADAEISQALILALGSPEARAMAMHPLPVPTSSRFIAAERLPKFFFIVSSTHCTSSSVSGLGISTLSFTRKSRPQKEVMPVMCCKGTCCLSCSITLSRVFSWASLRGKFWPTTLSAGPKPKKCLKTSRPMACRSCSG